MSEIELKACPFCGARPVMRERSGDERNGYNTSLTVECRCGASIDTETKNNGGLPTEAVAAAKRRLRSAWNTRASQWQPIESAPKDGTRLMLWDSRAGGYAVTGAWVAGSADDHESITHWQPLPAPPEVEG